MQTCWGAYMVLSFIGIKCLGLLDHHYNNVIKGVLELLYCNNSL